MGLAYNQTRHEHRPDQTTNVVLPTRPDTLS
jgi:hypothetical protein